MTLTTPGERAAAWAVETQRLQTGQGRGQGVTGKSERHLGKERNLYSI